MIYKFKKEEEGMPFIIINNTYTSHSAQYNQAIFNEICIKITLLNDSHFKIQG
jgi:hypothetical protein